MRKKKNELKTEENNYVDYNHYGMNDLDMEIIEEKEPISKVISNIIFIIIIALGIVIAIDVVCVTKYDKGPYLLYVQKHMMMVEQRNFMD